MDQIRTGELIRGLRKEHHLTQKQLAVRLHVSDKAISKWETGKGCPDISLLMMLADQFQVNLETLLTGEISEKESETGNMKKMKFYVCPDCGNILTSASDTDISCCGKKLFPLEQRKAEEPDVLHMEVIDGEWYITSEHEMTKEHYIAFVAFLTDNMLIMSRQYPEWNLQARMPLYTRGRLLWYCTECGLQYKDIRPSKK